MSRAFVKEDDGAAPVLRPEPELPPGVPNHVTPGGAARFEARLAALKAERGALRDSGLDVARRREIDDEVRWLERRMATFVVTRAPDPPARAGFGTVVTLARGEERRTIGIVGVDEVDPARGEVSFLSPLARAVRGAEVGDEVVVSTPSGEETWEIEDLRAMD